MFRKHRPFKNNIITPLYIIRDRYNGAYSGGKYLAFNLTSYGVSRLPIDAGDCECNAFWEGRDPDYDVNDYIIGKGNTPEEAYEDLVRKLKKTPVKFLLDEFHLVDGNNSSERRV